MSGVQKESKIMRGNGGGGLVYCYVGVPLGNDSSIASEFDGVGIESLLSVRPCGEDCGPIIQFLVLGIKEL